MARNILTTILLLTGIAIAATAQNSSQPPSTDQSVDQSVTKVNDRIAKLKAKGASIPAPGDAAARDITLDAIQKEMRGYTLVMSSRYLGSGDSATWELLLTDGGCSVRLVLLRPAPRTPYEVLSAEVNGDVVFASDSGYQYSEAAAFEAGDTYFYVDPTAARNVIDTLSVDAFEKILAEPTRDLHYPQESLCKPLTPANVLTQLEGNEGVTVFFDEAGVLLVVNRGEDIVALLNGDYSDPVGGGQFLTNDAHDNEWSSNDASDVFVGPSPAAVKVCQRLYHVCLTHEDDLGLRACELWLKFCASKKS